jgi:hypothetical protein
VPTLPLIDLLILAGTGSLFAGFILKAIAVTTHYRPSIAGFTALDFVIIAGICLAFALTFAARTWVKLNEPRLLVLRREAERRAREQAAEAEYADDPTPPALAELRAGAGRIDTR